MNPIDRTFQSLRRDGRKAFIPFLTAGDPDLATTAQLVRALSARGASLIEIGIPYSDPIADGPVIQASYTRALEHGIKLADIFAAVRALGGGAGPHGAAEKPGAAARDGVLAPLVAMVSYSVVFRQGAERFVGDAQEAGFAGAIVPDLPVEEAAELARLAARRDFKLIQLVTPTTPPDRAAQIARRSTGFIYCVSVTGITGERATIAPGVLEQVERLRKETDLPVCIGFGISRPEHVRLLAPVADGVIVGSAIVRRIADAAGKPADAIVREITGYAGTLIEALAYPVP
jgi:tryptophan synthase alpha chain